MRVRLGTRGSALALAQFEIAKNILLSQNPSIAISQHIIKTTGDIKSSSLTPQSSFKGLFVKEIQQQLISNQIDLAVHSLKDMEFYANSSLTIGAYLKRDSPYDALFSPKGYTWETLPQNAIVGTSSLRRAAEMVRIRPDLRIKPIRGNIDTRIKKCIEFGYDGIVIAAAAVNRLGFSSNISILSKDIILPAAGQGIIALECRSDDHKTLEMLGQINDKESEYAAIAERSLLNAIGGNCHTPIGAYCRIENDKAILEGHLYEDYNWFKNFGASLEEIKVIDGENTYLSSPPNLKYAYDSIETDYSYDLKSAEDLGVKLGNTLKSNIN